jgi:hypothetical protein
MLIDAVLHELGEKMFPDWDREMVLNHANELKPERPAHLDIFEGIAAQFYLDEAAGKSPVDVRLKSEVVAEIAAERRAENRWVEVYREATDRLLELCQKKLSIYGLDETGKTTAIDGQTWFGVHSRGALETGKCHLEGGFLTSAPSQMDRHAARLSGRTLPKSAFLVAKPTAVENAISGAKPGHTTDTRELETGLSAFIKREIQLSPDSPKTKNEIWALYENETGKVLQGLSRSKRDRCWSEAIRDTAATAWSKSGRRPSRRP